MSYLSVSKSQLSACPVKSAMDLSTSKHCQDVLGLRSPEVHLFSWMMKHHKAEYVSSARILGWLAAQSD